MRNGFSGDLGGEPNASKFESHSSISREYPATQEAIDTALSEMLAATYQSGYAAGRLINRRIVLLVHL